MILKPSSSLRIPALITLIFLLFTCLVKGQDLGFSYQAIARNDNGDPITSQNLQVKIQIRSNSTNGAIAYEEDHEVQTNSLGLFTLIIGEGTVQSGNFNSIPWTDNTYFVNVAINGNSIGGTRLEAVPYSKVATNMELQNLLDVDDQNPASGQVLTWNGNEWEPQNSQSGFSPVAGSGISISGNTINNTGDTNAGDDITDDSQAGGDLSGTFGNLNIRNNTIGTANIINGSISGDDINGSVEIPGPPRGGAGGDLGGDYPNPSVQRIQGNLVSDDDPNTGQVLTWTGGEWAPRDVSSSTGGSASGDVSGAYSGALTVTGLRGRTVAATPAPIANQVLTWSGTAWVPRDPPSLSGTASGDISGTFPGPLTVTQLQGRAVSNSIPADGQVLTWTGTAWAPQTVSSSGGGSPTGAASGDLSGLYPGPVVAKIQGNDVSPTDPTDGQVLTWSAVGAAWIPQTLPTSTGGTASGDVTGAYDGNLTVVQLRGQPISTTAPTVDGQVLTWTGGAWTPQAASVGGSSNATQLQGVNISATLPLVNQVLTYNPTLGGWVPQDAASGTGDITEEAVGDLEGTYPNLKVIRIQEQPVSATPPVDRQVLTYVQGVWTPQTLPTTTTTADGDVEGNLQSLSVVSIQGQAVSPTPPTADQVLAWNGTQWEPKTLDASTGSSNATQIQGQPIVVTAPQASQVLTWSGTQWEPQNIPVANPGTANGDVTGAYNELKIVALQGQQLSGVLPQQGQFLYWNGGQWTPGNLTDLADDSNLAPQSISSSSSTSLRQAQNTNATPILPLTSETLVTQNLEVSQNACALVTLETELEITDQGNGSFAQLSYGFVLDATQESQRSNHTLVVPELLPSGTPFLQTLQLTRKIRIPAGLSTLSAFAENSPNGESVVVNQATLVVQILSDASSACNE